MPSYVIGIGSDLQPWRNVDGSDPNDSSSVDNWALWAVPGVAILMGTGPANDAWEPASLVMINGDMTDFGWDAQRTAAQDLMFPYNVAHPLINRWADLPTFFGLGNHDIANNVGDCMDELQGCMRL